MPLASSHVIHFTWGRPLVNLLTRAFALDFSVDDIFQPHRTETDISGEVHNPLFLVNVVDGSLTLRGFVLKRDVPHLDGVQVFQGGPEGINNLHRVSVHSLFLRIMIIITGNFNALGIYFTRAYSLVKPFTNRKTPEGGGEANSLGPCH